MKNKTVNRTKPDTSENRKQLSKCKDDNAKLIKIKYLQQEENRVPQYK